MNRAMRRHHIKRLGKNRRRLISDFARPRSDNELATRHPLDCGQRCFMCHGEKLVNAGRRRLAWKREANREIADA